MSKALFKATSTVSFMTMLSRILGFVRDTLAAQIYGATASVDAFYVAFKIPNFMRNLFAEGCFSQAFVPVLAEQKQQKSHEEVQSFISHVIGALGTVLLLITIIGLFAAPLLVLLFAPGYHVGSLRFAMASDMLRITFPYLMLISLTAMAGGILNTYGRYSVPAFTPVLLNLCLIAAALWLSSFCQVPVEAQAWGVLAAGFIQLCFQWPFLKQLGFRVQPRLNWNDPGVKKVLTLMLPALFGASVGQLSLLLNTIFASFLAVGSVSWLYYSDRLAYFPLGVFGVAIATVVLPHLSAQHAQKSSKAFSSTLDWGIRCNLLIGIPAAVTLMVLAGPLIVSLFHYGHFTVHDVVMTRQSVIAYSVGLVSFMLVKVLTAAFYATQNVGKPVKIAIITIVANMVLNALLIWPLAHAGLALASSLASWLNTVLLVVGLYRANVYRFEKGWSKFIAQLVFANTALGVALVWGAGDLQQWLHWPWQQRLLHIFYLALTGKIVYVISLWLAGMRFHDIKVK